MDGLIIINKPIGYTSQDVVSKVKKILNVKKAGHTGTLDPMATGVLPVLLGKYTKLSKYLVEHDKKYIAKIQLGEKRDTGDQEGKVEETSDKIIENNEDVVEVLKTFIGKQKQIPPMYSSIKINGKKLYEYAREGETIDVPARDIEIYEIKFLDFDIKNQIIEFEAYVSKGTYIRTLCEDIAKRLGTLGYMKSLNRILVDNFKLEDAIDFETLEENKNNEDFLNKRIIKMEDLFKKYSKIILNDKKSELFLNGVNLSFNLNDGIYNIYNDKKYLGTGTIKNQKLKRDIII